MPQLPSRVIRDAWLAMILRGIVKRSTILDYLLYYCRILCGAQNSFMGVWLRK